MRLMNTNLSRSVKPLPPQAVKEFQALYAQHYHLHLSDDEAKSRALGFLQLYGLVSGEVSLTKPLASQEIFL
jgi:hypothetical protein